MVNRVKPPTISERRAGVQTVGKPPTSAQLKSGVTSYVKPPTVEEQKLIREYGSVELGKVIKKEISEETSRREKIIKELDSFSSKELTYDNYQKEYSKLSNEARQYAVSPEEIQKTEGYKQYKAYLGEKKRIEEYNQAVETIRKADAKGMVWAHAFYGEGIVQDLAKRYLKLKQMTKNAELKKQKELTEGSFIDPKTGLGYSMAPEFAKEAGYIPASQYIPQEKKGTISEPSKTVGNLISPEYSKLSQPFMVSSMSKVERDRNAKTVLLQLLSKETPIQKKFEAAKSQLGLPTFTRREEAEIALSGLETPARVLEFSSEGWRDIVNKSGLSLTKTRSARDVVITTPLFGSVITSPETGEELVNLKETVKIPEKEVKTAVAYVPEIITGAAYLIPGAGEVLLASEVAKGTKQATFPEKKVTESIDTLYREYNKVEPEEGYRKLNKDEFYAAVYPEVREQVVKGGVISAATATAFLGISGVVGGISKARRSKLYKRQYANYEDALKKYNQLREASKYADIINEEPMVSTGVVKKGTIPINELKALDLPSDVLNKVSAVEVSQGTQKILQRVPKIKSIETPVNSKLYKRGIKKNYFVDTETKELFRNIITYKITTESGEVFTRSLVYYTNKPLTKFRTPSNALRYSKGKRIITGETKEGSEFFFSEVGKKIPSGIKREDFFISKGSMEDGTFLTTTKRPGKLKKYTGSLDELYEFSPEVSKTRSLRRDKRIIETTDGESLGIFKEISARTSPKDPADLSLIFKISKERPLLKKGKSSKLDSLSFKEGKVSEIKKSPVEKISDFSSEKLIGTKSESITGTTITPEKQIGFSEEVASPILGSLGKELKMRKVTPRVSELTKNSLKFKSGFSSLGLSASRFKSQEKSKLREDLSFKTDLKIKEDFSSREDVTLREDLGIREDVGIREDLDIGLKLDQTTPTRPIGVNFSGIPKIRDIPDVPSRPTDFISLRFRRKRPKYVKTQPYDVEVKRESLDPNRKRWEKANTAPLTKDSALSVGAREVDKSISAQFRIKKSEPVVVRTKNQAGKIIMKKVQRKAQELNDDYFKANRQKFREYSSTNKKKKALPTGRFIEKQKYRLDSVGEKRGISIARIK